MILEYKGKQNYKVVIDNCLISKINDYYKFGNEKKLIITDSNIPSEYIDELVLNLSNCYVYKFKAGEESKKIETVLDILDFLVKNEFSRTDYLISLGGGVCSDISGFVASIFKRGIKLILIPTSTLAMIDASIGCKNGVDYEGYKNVFGTFYYPSLILMDLSLLKSLPERHYYNGLVEALKMGLLVDSKLYKLFLNGNFKDNIQDIIYLSVLDKMNIVKKDEIDSSLRMILNFGHTIGHAIEAIHMGSIYHGEAVAKGMLYMIDDNKLKNEVRSILMNMNIDVNLNDNNDEIKKYVQQDKKIRDGQLNLIKLHKLNDFYIKKVRVGDFNVIDL